MQATAASCLISSIVLPTRSSTKSLVPPSSKPHKNFTKISAAAVNSPETSSTIDYSSSTSVFPMEAYDVLGGEACKSKMFPEVKLAAETSTSKPRMASEEIARDYLEYTDPKTKVYSMAGFGSFAPRTKNLFVAGGLSGFVLGVYYYTMRAVGGSDELQVAIDKFEQMKKNEAETPSTCVDRS